MSLHREILEEAVGQFYELQDALTLRVEPDIESGGDAGGRGGSGGGSEVDYDAVGSEVKFPRSGLSPIRGGGGGAHDEDGDDAGSNATLLESPTRSPSLSPTNRRGDTSSAILGELSNLSLSVNRLQQSLDTSLTGSNHDHKTDNATAYASFSEAALRDPSVSHNESINDTNSSTWAAVATSAATAGVTASREAGGRKHRRTGPVSQSNGGSVSALLSTPVASTVGPPPLPGSDNGQNGLGVQLDLEADLFAHEQEAMDLEGGGGDGGGGDGGGGSAGGSSGGSGGSMPTGLPGPSPRPPLPPQSNSLPSPPPPPPQPQSHRQPGPRTSATSGAPVQSRAETESTASSLKPCSQRVQQQEPTETEHPHLENHHLQDEAPIQQVASFHPASLTRRSSNLMGGGPVGRHHHGEGLTVQPNGATNAESASHAEDRNVGSLGDVMSPVAHSNARLVRSEDPRTTAFTRPSTRHETSGGIPARTPTPESPPHQPVAAAATTATITPQATHHITPRPPRIMLQNVGGLHLTEKYEAGNHAHLLRTPPPSATPATTPLTNNIIGQAQDVSPSAQATDPDAALEAYYAASLGLNQGSGVQTNVMAGSTILRSSPKVGESYYYHHPHRYPHPRPSALHLTTPLPPVLPFLYKCRRSMVVDLGRMGAGALV